ncbi:MAG: DUF6265 family protein [Maribacter sp.]
MKFFVLLIFGSFWVQAQNTLPFQENGESPKANLTSIEWLAGHWQGEAFGGIAEEIWSPPLGGVMLFSFRLVAEGTISFYEFGHILETDGTLILQLKHFDPNLQGWEEKDETIDFKLVKVEENRLFFDDFTIEYVSDKEINMYVLIEEDDGTTNEVKFNYHRQ